MLRTCSALQFAFVVLLLTACSSSAQQNQAKKYSFEFPTSGTNPSMIGRKVYAETGEPVSISSLCRHDNRVYLVDPLHRNVKAVDLKTGALTVSEQLGEKTERLTDIIVWNGALLVSTDEDVIYQLTPSLTVSETRSLDGRFGEKKFLKHGGNVYVYSDPQDVEQASDRSMSVNALRIGYGLSLIADTLRLGLGHERYRKVADGYELTNSRKCLETTTFRLCLDRGFPIREYFWRHISVNENSVSFFEFRNGKFHLVSIDAP